MIHSLMLLLLARSIALLISILSSYSIYNNIFSSSNMVKHELPVTSCEFQVTSYELKA